MIADPLDGGSVKDSRLLFDGKYEVLAKIREGGMGAVYEVRHRLLHEKRVIKVMRPGAGAGPDLERRFLDEAKIAIRLETEMVIALFVRSTSEIERALETSIHEGGHVQFDGADES